MALIWSSAELSIYLRLESRFEAYLAISPFFSNGARRVYPIIDKFESKNKVAVPAKNQTLFKDKWGLTVTVWRGLTADCNMTLLPVTARAAVWLRGSYHGNGGTPCATHHRIRQILPSKQNICIPFVQCWTNVEDVGPTLYKWNTNVSCLLCESQSLCEVNNAVWMLLQHPRCSASILTALGQRRVTASQSTSQQSWLNAHHLRWWAGIGPTSLYWFVHHKCKCGQRGEVIRKSMSIHYRLNRPTGERQDINQQIINKYIDYM